MKSNSMGIKVKIRKVGRSMRDTFNKASKICSTEMGYEFHRKFRDDRFTAAHAKRARYADRQGDQFAKGSKEWRRSYQGQKFRAVGHNRPLEYSGATRGLTNVFRVTAVGGGASAKTVPENRYGGEYTTKAGQNVRTKITYPLANTFNLRSRNQRARMAEEFRHVMRDELDYLGTFYDKTLDATLANPNLKQ